MGQAIARASADQDNIIYNVCMFISPGLYLYVFYAQLRRIGKTMTTFYIKRQLLSSILIIHNTMNR